MCCHYINDLSIFLSFVKGLTYSHPYSNALLLESPDAKRIILEMKHLYVWQSMVNMLCCKVFPIFRMHNVQFDKLPDVSLCVMYVLQLSLKSDLVY